MLDTSDTTFLECEGLSPRRKCICRNEAGIPLNGRNSTNSYRMAWGLSPIGPIEDVTTIVSDYRNPPRILISSGISKPRARGVGSCLHEVLIEIGINPPCLACGSFAAQMDSWGIEGCRTEHRAEILNHLRGAATQASWGDWLKVVAAGYLTNSMILDEAIRRAEAERDSLGESLP